MKPNRRGDVIAQTDSLSVHVPDPVHRPIRPWSEGGASPRIVLMYAANFKKQYDISSYMDDTPSVDREGEPHRYGLPLIVEHGVAVHSDGLCNHVEILWDNGNRAASMERYRRWRGLVPPTVDPAIRHPPPSLRENLQDVIAYTDKPTELKEGEGRPTLAGRAGDAFELKEAATMLAHF